MYLALSIFLATLLGFLLLMMDPILGGLIAFGIVTGCLFRGLYLLNDISKRLSKVSPKTDKVQDAYNRYIERRDSE
ncbi:hypothetical protein [Sporosarcina obsidiansis]|uniref:hypothetical protein n=1 Tax=Sporosarcina obsidiansis TaxID=2660748 RepID=UPI00129AE7E5|nr:hypothetical protein [Sporosarcina obsidiansis]